MLQIYVAFNSLLLVANSARNAASGTAAAAEVAVVVIITTTFLHPVGANIPPAARRPQRRLVHISRTDTASLEIPVISLTQKIEIVRN